MVASVDYPWNFIGVALFDQDNAFIVADHEQSVEDFVPFGAMLRWTKGWESRIFRFFPVDACVTHDPDRSLLVIGFHGAVIRWQADGCSQEQIVQGSERVWSFGSIQAVRTIDNHAYAVGRGRLVYRRNGVDDWMRIDHGVRADEEGHGSVGFNSIDGFSGSDIYAVGLNGEIWRYDGQIWCQCRSPTKDNLGKVVCAGDGHVYLLGQQGLILKGRHDEWTVLEQNVTGDGFHGGCWFKNKLYACTANGLWVLNDDTLSAVDIGKHETRRSSCFGRLDASDDYIWSVGAKMLLRSADGETWDEVPYPEIEQS